MIDMKEPEYIEGPTATVGAGGRWRFTSVVAFSCDLAHSEGRVGVLGYMRLARMTSRCAL
jgi:hypothetical protein